MKKYLFTFILGAAILGCTSVASTSSNSDKEVKTNSSTTIKKEAMKLGAFSVSLSVKDLAVSKEFYEKLGFHAMGGAMEQNYLIMKSEDVLIGLFQGMFEGNILTFNPGWDQNAKNVDPFDDVRALQKEFNGKGLKAGVDIDESTTGPANFIMTDPDGNVIYFDQHR